MGLREWLSTEYSTSISFRLMYNSALLNLMHTYGVRILSYVKCYIALYYVIIYYSVYFVYCLFSPHIYSHEKALVIVHRLALET